MTEAVAQRCSIKKALLEISQNPQENTCARVTFFSKVAGLSMNFVKLLRTPFCKEQLCVTVSGMTRKY